MRIISIEVPYLPPPECSPNSKCHWSRRYGAAQLYKTFVYYYGYAAKRELGFTCEFPLKNAVLNLTFIFSTNRRRDEDNLIAQFKPGQDALVAVGLVVDDDTSHLKSGKVTILVDKARAPMTIIELEDNEED